MELIRHNNSRAALTGASGCFVPANTTGAPSIIQNRIALRILVSVLAVCFGCIGFACVSPANVFGSSHRFKVIGIDARANPAQMIKLKASGDRPLDRLVNNSMCSGLDIAMFELAVTSGVKSAEPNPAARICDHFKVIELLFKGQPSGSHAVHFTTS